MSLKQLFEQFVAEELGRLSACMQSIPGLDTGPKEPELTLIRGGYYWTFTPNLNSGHDGIWEGSFKAGSRIRFDCQFNAEGKLINFWE